MSEREHRFGGYRRAWMWARDVHGSDLELSPGGAGSGRYPFGDRAVHVLTAFDPGAERLDAEENARRQQALVAELPERLVGPWEVVVGAADGSHTETSTLVEGLTDAAAVALGARWGQDAVFRWTPEAWSILPCDGGEAIELGWTLRLAITDCGGPGRCGRYQSGHHTHTIQARRTGETPWGWRDGVVTAADGGLAEIRYVLDDAGVSVAHHGDLALGTGDPVRVHEEFRMLGTPSGWRCVLLRDGGLGAVPEPGDPSAWAAETSPGIVDLGTGDGVATDHRRSSGNE